MCLLAERNLDLPAVHGEFHVKTAYVEGLPYVAVKVASGFYDNPGRGLPSGSGLMALFDASTGFPAALLLDNGFLTDIRTAAAGALAADLLARRRIEQVRCLAIVRSFSRVMAWSPTRVNLDRYVADMAAAGFHVDAAPGAEDVCRSADVLITATPARGPIVEADWLREGVHVTALGSDSPGKQELSPGCLAKADLVVVDRLDQCAAFGELRHALDAGLVTRGDVHAELGEIAAGRKPGRTADRQITIADLTGVGFQDTAIASAVFGLLR